MILALQFSDAVHVGVDNLGVVRHVGRLLKGHHGSTPFELVTDADLLVLIDRMLYLRGYDTVRSTKVKGHADEGMVLDGRVRELDRLGHDAADEAADFGRRRVGPAVVDAFIGSPLPFLEPLLIMMGVMVLLLILWSGLLELCQRGDGWFMLCVALPCCLDHLQFGLVIGSMVLLLLLAMRMLLIGHTHLVFWLSELPF